MPIRPRIDTCTFLAFGLAFAACTRGGTEDGDLQRALPTEAAAAKPTAASRPNVRDPASLNETAPAKFKVRLETTEGDIVMDVHRPWAPRGADRFYNLVKAGFYDGVAFFRVIKGFMAQTGIHGDPTISVAWADASIQDDPVEESNTRGMVSFATAGPNTRTTQFFINFGDNSRLDGMGFAPFAKVERMTTVDKLYDKYGEGAPRGSGPSQARMRREGNAYLKKEFKNLDYILKATVE